MIPILYDKTETAFVSNGLARLRDCVSCVVSETRNGAYECDFEYPVSGAHFDLIQIGRIIGVTHDETDDIQPFDIISYTKPIEGVVTFHAVHISYRQSYLTVTGSNINSLEDAFTLFASATPTNPFIYSTDKNSTGYLSIADGVPKTVRQMLGGTEGSVLDTYGGEYVWDKWNVKLLSARGRKRNFSIYYGVNMMSYNEECDSSSCYSSCVPYWTDGSSTVIGDKQTAPGITASGRDQCVPLDVSDKFEGQPTKAQVEAMGLSLITSQNTTAPTQNITVSFIRLQDMAEYESYQQLMMCELCDTINVVFPESNSSGSFKIVKTTWNVLENRYESMELGALATTLSEALGLSNGGNSSLDFYTPRVFQAISTGTNKSLTTGTITQVTLDSNDVIINSDASISSGGVKLPSSGTYKITASVYIDSVAAATGYGVYVRKGSAFSTATEIMSILNAKGSAAHNGAVEVSKAITVSANDIIFLAGRTIGSTGTLRQNHASTFLLIEKL